MTEAQNSIERRVAAFDVVRVLLAAILLTAAALKGHQLATEPVAARSRRLVAAGSLLPAPYRLCSCRAALQIGGIAGPLPELPKEEAARQPFP